VTWTRSVKWDREGEYETHVRAHRAQTHIKAPLQRLHVIMTRWHELIRIARNPYRPELHYIEGPAQSGTRSIESASTRI